MEISGGLDVSQYIRISGRGRNDRINKAIPKFMAKGMARDQATATAIRLESLGRLKPTGTTIAKGKPSGSAFTALAALTIGGIPKKTQTRKATKGTYKSTQQLQRATKKTTRTRRTTRTTKPRKRR